MIFLSLRPCSPFTFFFKIVRIVIIGSSFASFFAFFESFSVLFRHSHLVILFGEGVEFEVGVVALEFLDANDSSDGLFNGAGKAFEVGLLVGQVDDEGV